MRFAAIDFETATGYANSACAVGIVTVENGIIIDEFYSLIQPPDNEYWFSNIKVHGIRPQDTVSAPAFYKVFPEIQSRIEDSIVVAHNESFDRNVLKKSMETYGLYYDEFNFMMKWECTCRIYRAKGYKPANLKACSERNNIELNHHDALSDARACALLYLNK